MQSEGEEASVVAVLASSLVDVVLRWLLDRRGNDGLREGADALRPDLRGVDDVLLLAEASTTPPRGMSTKQVSTLTTLTRRSCRSASLRE